MNKTLNTIARVNFLTSRTNRRVGKSPEWTVFRLLEPIDVLGNHQCLILINGLKDVSDNHPNKMNYDHWNRRHVTRPSDRSVMLSVLDTRMIWLSITIADECVGQPSNWTVFRSAYTIVVLDYHHNPFGFKSTGPNGVSDNRQRELCFEVSDSH